MLFDFSHHAGDNTEYVETHFRSYVDNRIIAVLGNQPRETVRQIEYLDAEFSVDIGDDYVVIVRFKGAVNYKNIVVEYSGFNHGVSVNTHEEGRGGLADHQFVQIKSLLHVILGR